MLQVDSRCVKMGDTFVALSGVEHDGHHYINDAISNGAKRVVVEHGLYPVDTLVVKNTHDYLISELDALYHEKLKDMVFIGVTGTNGKTTVCSLIWQALKKQGEKCAYIGTIGFYMDELVRPLSNTTPDVFDLYQMLMEAHDYGCHYIVMEVSSHALYYERIGKLKFDIAIFTNLTEDHLEFHKTMDAYALEKQKLFYALKKEGIAIVNGDDPYKNYFLVKENKNITYGFYHADILIKDVELKMDETLFTLNDIEYKTKLLGKYNIYNLTCAMIALKELGYTLDPMEVVCPVGRLDIVKKEDKTIIIDYAHTPDAVSSVLKNVQEFSTGKIVTILGCGGNREKEKRPKMGELASRFSDICIFTSDNPRHENPMDILNDMIKDIVKDNVIIILNRKEAIEKGLQIIGKNDILLILGKGHETYQVIGDEKIEFNDKKIVEEL